MLLTVCSLGTGKQTAKARSPTFLQSTYSANSYLCEETMWYFIGQSRDKERTSSFHVLTSHYLFVKRQDTNMYEYVTTK